jgi:hypothetical protein
MKNRTQTIINVCFAISITAFIYQNGQQQDRIDTLERESFSNADHFELRDNTDFSQAVVSVVMTRCELERDYRDVLDQTLYCNM